MADSLTRARQLVDELRASGITAVLDANTALANLPCVLVAPPRLTFDLPTGATATWRLVAIAADGTGSPTAWQQLVDLVDDVAAHFPVELAEPTSYVLGQGVDPLPAYAVTFSEAID